MYHAASNGGILPAAVDSEKNRIIQEQLENTIGIYQVSLADRLNEWYSQDNDLSSFTDYASKGFISLDRTEDDRVENNEKLRYHTVAYPLNGEVYSNEEILRLMPELKDGEIEIE